MDVRNRECRGDQLEYNWNPHSVAPPTCPSDHYYRHQNQENFGGSAPISGLKRPSNGLTHVKLYVVGIPRSAELEDVRIVFSQHGHIVEVFRLKDKITGLGMECCFVNYSTLDEADSAIQAFNGQYIFPGCDYPLTVRYADGERERLGLISDEPTYHKLYVSGLRKQATKGEIDRVFSAYGIVKDVYILGDEQKQSRGSAFVRFACRDMAVAAINALHGTSEMELVGDQPLVVRFADPKKPKGEELFKAHMNEQQLFIGNVAANYHQSPNRITPNNRSIPQIVFSTNFVGPDTVLPSDASSVVAKSLKTEMVDSINCDWSEHVSSDGAFRCIPRTVLSSNCVGSDKVSPSYASSVVSKSLNTEMVDSIDCDWSELTSPDGAFRSISRAVFSTNCVGSDNVLLSSDASSVVAKSLETEIVESINYDWSGSTSPDGFSYYSNCDVKEHGRSLRSCSKFLKMDVF